ncbi:hypothetical protein B7Y94_01620 [Candidatus Saccharibacteria bacterium 32-49-12]|nr:MAG: hypothetical protein B7Y94_01620 [Candidatus Saccharibacteria bacterium 32-49-12]
MEIHSYWRKQEVGSPLFSEIEWNKPERRSQAGKLGIIGGNKLSFVAAAESYEIATKNGVGEVRVLLPDSLKKSVPPAMTDVIFGPSNHAGGLATEAENEVKSLGEWADVLLLSGDAGKNSQTAMLYENLVSTYDKPIVITRDAIDLLQNSFPNVLDNPNVVLVASLAQVQRIFRAIYYPKMITFNMQLAQLVETLHKFTITHPLSIVTLHSEQLIIAKAGEVITQDWSDPMRIWRGHTAAQAASYLVWTPNEPTKAVVTSIS